MRENGVVDRLQRQPVKLPDIISALSLALDLTEGAIPGHAVRSTLIGMRLGALVGLPTSDLGSLYYALQLKDVGCSSNAARMTQLFGGDDRTAKAVTKLTDWTGLLNVAHGSGGTREKVTDLAAGLWAVPRNARMLWGAVLPGATVTRRLQRIAALGKQVVPNTEELLALRCDRGALILRKLEMSQHTCESVRHLDEHWDGSGYPDGLKGESIPLLARISAIAQNLDVFATSRGVEESVRTLKRRSGTWFDPELVKAVVTLHKAGYLWKDCEPGCPVEKTRLGVMALSPSAAPALQADQIDSICEAFSDVVDAKSPFTFRHSLGVAEVTKQLSEVLGLDTERKQLLQRAALLHDLGKLGVPNTILDKPGPLTEAERRLVIEHPGMSRSILSRIAGFEELARIAGEHHEKLDGSGYPHGLAAENLSTESRLLTLADCFAALAEERPYRGRLPVSEVLSILRRETSHKLDAALFEALEGIVVRWGDTLPAVFTPTYEVSACSFLREGPPAEMVLSAI